MSGDLADKRRNTTVSTDDKELYAIAALELSSDKVDIGLKAKAFADADGNKERADALYLKMRVGELAAERIAIQRTMQLDVASTLPSPSNSTPKNTIESLVGLLTFLVFFGWIYTVIGLHEFIQHKKFSWASPGVFFEIAGATTAIGVGATVLFVISLAFAPCRANKEQTFGLLVVGITVVALIGAYAISLQVPASTRG